MSNWISVILVHLTTCVWNSEPAEQQCGTVKVSVLNDVVSFKSNNSFLFLAKLIYASINTKVVFICEETCSLNIMNLCLSKFPFKIP